jgi:hypothetical protein
LLSRAEASQKSREVQDTSSTLPTLQARSSLSEETLAFLRTRTLSHEIDGVFQWHRLAAQTFDRHRFEELFPTKYVKATSRRIEMQHDLMPWKARL